MAEPRFWQLLKKRTPSFPALLKKASASIRYCPRHTGKQVANHSSRTHIFRRRFPRSLADPAFGVELDNTGMTWCLCLVCAAILPLRATPATREMRAAAIEIDFGRVFCSVDCYARGGEYVAARCSL